MDTTTQTSNQARAEVFDDQTTVAIALEMAMMNRTSRPPRYGDDLVAEVDSLISACIQDGSLDRVDTIGEVGAEVLRAFLGTSTKAMNECGGTFAAAYVGALQTIVNKLDEKERDRATQKMAEVCARFPFVMPAPKPKPRWERTKYASDEDAATRKNRRPPWDGQKLNDFVANLTIPAPSGAIHPTATISVECLPNVRGGFLFQLHWQANNATSGQLETQHSAKHFVSAWSAPNEIAQAILAACIRAAEHEIRETFSYRGVAVYRPHQPLNELAEFTKQTPAEVRIPAVAADHLAKCHTLEGCYSDDEVRSPAEGV